MDTSTLPELPTEIWSQIIGYLPLLENERLWVPWLQYRLVNHVFKRTIEDFYVANVLSRARIYAEVRGHYNSVSNEPIRFPNGDFMGRYQYDFYGEYWFAGFADPQGRYAMLRLNEHRCTVRKDYRHMLAWNKAWFVSSPILVRGSSA
jgi:hypothetical protein